MILGPLSIKYCSLCIQLFIEINSDETMSIKVINYKLILKCKYINIVKNRM